MAIVPPGNKQIGSFSLDVLTSSGDSLAVTAASAYTVLKDSNITYSLRLPETISIGNFSLDVLTSRGDSLAITSAAAYVVAKYLPPPTLTITTAAAYAVLKDTTVSYTLAEPINLFIGNFGLEVLTRSEESVLISSAAVYAVLKGFTPRSESIIHSLYFGTNNPFLGTEFDPYA